MKDYSMFIKNAFGFVTGYEIANGEVLVSTPHTKKGEPQRYPTQKAMHYEKRLENQFKMLIEHQDEIIAYNRKKATKLFIPFYTILGVIEAFLLIVYGIGLITRIGLVIIALSVGTTIYAQKKSENKFKENLKQYDRYIKNRQKIEQSEEKDANVTAYLNEKTLSLIDQNKKYKQQGIIDSTFNIGLMDKMSLKELKKLLERYKISESLQQEQTFLIPNEISEVQTQPSNPKKKSLLPQKNRQTDWQE